MATRALEALPLPQNPKDPGLRNETDFRQPLPEFTQNQLQDPANFSVQSNETWGTTTLTDWIGDPNNRVASSEVQEPERDVQQEIDRAFDAADDLRFGYENGNISKREYKKGLRETVAPIGDKEGIDNLAYSFVSTRNDRDRLQGRDDLDEDDEAELAAFSGGVITIDEMAKALPRRSRGLFGKKVKLYEQSGTESTERAVDDTDAGAEDDEDGPDIDDAIDIDLDDEGEIEPDADGTDTTATGPRESLARRATRKGAELLRRRRKTAIAVGAVAVAGISFAITKGLITPEQAAQHAHLVPGGGGGGIRMQLEAFTHKLHHGGGAHKAVHGHVLTPPKDTRDFAGMSIYPFHTAFRYMGRGLGEGLGGATVDSSFLAVGALAVHTRRQHRHHEHLHEDHEARAKTRAEARARTAIVDPNIPDSARLSADLKNPRLASEIAAHGSGLSGVAYSTDAVRRYARIYARHMGGDAAAVRDHLVELFGGEGHARDHGVDLDHLSIFDRRTNGGRTVVDIRLSNPAVLAIAEKLESELVNMPVDPFGNAGVAKQVEYLANLRKLEMYGVEFSYRRATIDHFQPLIRKRVNDVVEKISRAMPSNAAREAALKAMGLDKYIEPIVTSVDTETVPVYEMDASTGKPRTDVFGRPIPKYRMLSAQPVLGPQGMPVPAAGNTVKYIPDPTHPGTYMIDPANPGNGNYVMDRPRPDIDPTTGLPIPITRTHRVKRYRRPEPGQPITTDTVYRLFAGRQSAIYAADALIRYANI